MYDTVAQFDQVTSGNVADWHPPIMVRLWQLLSPLWPGTGPMFVLQVALYALGFALIVSALARQGRRYASLAVALLAISPLLLGWQMVVLKDAQMFAALICAFGVVAYFRMRDGRVPPLAGAAVLILIGYATLVRANAMFATIPLFIFLLERPRSIIVRGALSLLVISLLLASEPSINHRVLGASSSGVEKSQPIFDLAAIATAVPGSVPPFTPHERGQLIANHCVKAFFWDPLGDPSACGSITERVNSLSEHELYLALGREAAFHPLAYAEHRLKHWNATQRWLVQPGLIDAAPPQQAEPNDDGLEGPTGSLVSVWQKFAALEARTPLGWPIAWITVALLLLPIAWRRRSEVQGSMALALLVSSLTLEASFFIISIASDLRYHLWSLAAIPLALILLSNDLQTTRRYQLIAAALLAIVVGGGVLSRMVLPSAPNGYQAMLHGPTS